VPCGALAAHTLGVGVRRSDQPGETPRVLSALLLSEALTVRSRALIWRGKGCSSDNAVGGSGLHRDERTGKQRLKEANAAHDGPHAGGAGAASADAGVGRGFVTSLDHHQGRRRLCKSL
jgi:hypothetical protein